MQILVAEDEPTCASVLRARLERLGHDVTVVDDGWSAWERLNAGDIRLVITDWMMPGLDGPGLCRLIRSEPGKPYVYAILMTSLSEPERRMAGLDAGADDFLTKRPDLAELAARVRIAERILAMQAELERKNVRLAELATTDGLTGLRNRRFFEESLASASSFAIRHGSPLSVVLLDVDRFKAFNDGHGHQEGDAVLRGVAEVLAAGAREHDVAARYGGEEFVLLLPGTDAEAAACVAERLRSSIERRGWAHGPITASFGIATTTSADGPTLVARADRALYESKRRGRNRVSHADEIARGPRLAVKV